MAALLTSVLDNSDKVAGYISECRDCGIALLPPDINRSADRFTVEEGGIRFGLVAIKNIGRGFIQAVMREREQAPFTSLYDFCDRMTGSDINKRAVENLIRSGAFDSLGARRSQLIQVYESVMDAVADSRRQNLEGQMDFFSLADGGNGEKRTVKEIPLPDIDEYTPEERMLMEKETTGLYLSGHPMDQYREAVRRLGAPTIGSILEDFAQEGGPTRFADDQRITICGIVTSSKTKTTKNNSLMAYVTVEDDTASMELLCFCPGAGDLRRLPEGEPGSGGKGAAVRPGREGPPDPVRLHLSLCPRRRRHSGTPAASRKRQRGADAVPEVPQHRRPRHPPHEAGVPDVPRQHRGENGHGGHPKGLWYPGLTAPGPGAGSPGDAG